MPPIKPPRPDRPAAVEVNAARGPHTPPPPPARSKLDSQEVSTDSILAEYKAAEDRRRAAEARAVAAEARAAAAESGVTAQGPKFSLGSAKWWVLVLGALVLASPQIKEWTRPSASAEQIAAVQQTLQDLTKRLDRRDAALATTASADARRWTIAAAFLCSQGFRARGLDCAAAQAFADIQPVPLQPKAAPQWKATTPWPNVPTPQD